MSKRVMRSPLYLVRKSSFDRLRRASKLSFDELYRLFADNISLYEIARRAGVSRTRVATIYRDHFSDIFQTSAIARLRERERSQRQKTAAHVNALISNDSVLNEIRELAAPSQIQPHDSAHNAEAQRRADQAVPTPRGDGR